MLNWESELKRFIAKKFNEIIKSEDHQITSANICTVEIEMEFDLNTLTVNELAHIYAFAIMKEDFEHAEKFADALTKKGFTIKIETDDVKKFGAINVYDISEKIVTTIPIKVYPDGMMVDFEKDNDFKIE